MERLTAFTAYAKEFNCSVARAIHDRDWPMTLDECTDAFVESTGRKPTADEIKEMSPDSDEGVREWVKEQRSDHA